MSRQELVRRAREILRKAREELGQDLGGYSGVDLLLDNMRCLKNSSDARRLLALAEEVQS